MNTHSIKEKRRYRYILYCILALLYALFWIQNIYCQTPTFYIPYGSILPSLTLDTDIKVIFLDGPGENTIVEGDIDLSGLYSSIEVTSAQIFGSIILGDTAGGLTSFVGQEAFIQNSILMYGDTAILHLKKNLVIESTISLFANMYNHAILEDIILFKTLSMGLGGEKNILEVINSSIQATDIFLDATFNIIHITGESSISPSSLISIWGASEITIDSPLGHLDFFKFETNDIHSLTLKEGYIKLTTDELIIPLPDIVGSTFTISGSTILGDIIVNPNIDVHVKWYDKTYFVGTLYTDPLKTHIIGIGLSNEIVTLPLFPISLPTGFILGIQDNTIWNGDIAGTKLQLGIVESAVNGDINIIDSELFIANSILTGNLHITSSRVIFDTITFQGKNLTAQEIYLEGTLSYNKVLSGVDPVLITIDKLHVSKHLETVFSTHNNRVGETVKLFINDLQGYSKPSVFFQGDVDFTSLTADILILQPNSYQTEYVVDYIMQNIDIYTDIRRIENVLQGFSVAPRLLRNTMSGYDVILEENPATPGSYDIVLLGYSLTNDAFAGAFLGQSLHLDALETTRASQLVQNLSVLINPRTKGIRGASVWSAFSFFYSEHTQPEYSRVKTQLWTGTIGASSAPVSFTNNFISIFDIFFQLGYSRSKINDIKFYNSHTSTLSFMGQANATSLITITDIHFWFFSLSLGAGTHNTDIVRPYSATSDTWKTYSVMSSIHTGYTGKFNGFSLSSYLGLGYMYTSKISLTSEDNTHVERKASNTLYPSISLLLDYTSYGIRPYIHSSFIAPIQLSKSKMKIAQVEHEYNQDTMYTNSNIGLEYTAMLRYTQISFAGELGIRATLEKHSYIVPYVDLKLTISF